MKKNIWGISIGVVAVIIVVIGGVIFQKQTDEKKKISAAQNEITQIEKTTTKGGALYKEVASLYDDQHDFLAKEIKESSLKETLEKVQNEQLETEKLKEKYGTKITTKKADDTLNKLKKEVTEANNKLAIQTKTNELFSSKEAAIDGDNVKDELPITVDLTQKKITTVSDLVKENKELNGKWKESIDKILKNATDQVTETEKIKKLFAQSFDGNVPKNTVQQSAYDTLNKEVEKVKNAELKAGYAAQLVLMKAVIDTRNKLNELNQQQQEAGKVAEQAVNDALAKAKADVDQATEQAKSDVDASILVGYSDDQIEFARVWLTVIGTKNSALYINRIPAGSPINTYDNGSVGYPTDVISLSGPATADGSVVYSSNHNGTITVYPVPGHWQMPAEIANNPEKIREMTQKVIDDARVVSVDVCNPRDVLDVIWVEKN